MSDLVLHWLAIENFKSFVGKHSFELERKPGLYYIAGKNKVNPKLGANGAGKTTLWDALTWVLWGKTGRDARPADQIIPWGMKGTVEVNLQFTRQGKLYNLTRSRHPNTLQLWRKGKAITIEQQDIQELIGMSEEMFRRTMVLGQFGSLFMDLRPEQQTAMFNEALDLDLWLRASSIAGKKAKTLEADRFELQTALAKLEGSLTALTESVLEESRADVDYKAKLKVELDALKKRVIAKEGEIERLLLEAKAPAEALGGAKRGRWGEDALEAALASATPLKSGLEKARGLALGGELALETRLVDLRGEIADYEKALARGQACPACGQSTSKEHLRKKLQQLTDNLTSCIVELRMRQDETAEIKIELGKLNKSVEALYKISQTIKAHRYDIDQLNHAYTLKRNAVSPHKAMIATLDARLIKLSETKAESEALLVEAEKAIKVCDYWVTSFKEIRLSLIDQAMTELEMAVQRHAESLGLTDWRVKFQTERETKAGNVSVVFNILLYPPDQEAVKWESYSGGESQRWQLAVAFGLSEIILARTGVEPNLEVLDEPTRGLSPEGIEDLLEHLAERAEELERAIYVTEHHSLERGHFAKTITIVKDENGSTIQE